jgi:SPP1 family predicted phage head-tail adaptor
MNIGAMRTKITFQKSAVTVDKYGNHTNGWTDYCSCWATVGTSTGSESEGVVVNPEESLDFTCRYCIRIIRKYHLFDSLVSIKSVGA